MKITVLSTPNSKFGPYTVVYNMAAWPARVVASRGWNGPSVGTVYERPATEIEIEEQRQSPRYLCFRNKSWEHLVGDEAKYGVDAVAARDVWRASRRA